MPSETGISVQPLSSWKNYDDDEQQCQLHFSNTFHQPPDFIVRVPGRVNIIGEHIDYCGYGVFPMAIEKYVTLGVKSVPVNNKCDGTAEPYLKVINTNNIYEDFSCPTKQAINELKNRKKGSPPDWHLYVLCGIVGALEYLDKNGGTSNISMQMCVDGNIPSRSGLSSSSALVCAANVATLLANKAKPYPCRNEVIEMCANCERYIGTAGGGMDQAIAFMASEGAAQSIEFLPCLQGESVPLPEGAVFLIANSLAEANKAASQAFNQRVAECRLATWILAKFLQSKNPFDFNKLKMLQIEYKCSLEWLAQLTDQQFHAQPYHLSEVAAILELKLEDLEELPLVRDVSKEFTEFHLYQRIKHVLNETRRVEKFKSICLNHKTEAKLGSEDTLVSLGELMDESHESLKTMYDCSHKMLDKLREVLSPFVYGSRLTGAGFGGCVVSLVKTNKMEPLKKALEEEFYRKYYGIDGIESHVFISKPGPGAGVYELLE